MVLAANVHDDAGGERFVLAGAVTGAVECVGDLGVGVGVEEPTELIERSVKLMNSLRGDGWKVA